MAFTTSNVSKYRLGPPASIILDLNTSNPIDLGSTMGGVTFTYKQTHFKAIADQVIGPVADWRTEESGTVELSIPEISVPRLLTAFGYPTTQYTTILAGAAISAPGAFVPVPFGTTGAAAYGYSLFAFNSNGDGVPTAGTAISTGNTQLSATNYNIVPFPSLPAGAVGFGVLRTTGGAASTVAAGSNGYALPNFGATATTLLVASTTGFATSGTASVVTSTGIQTFSYTGVSGGNSFTGCSGGTGVLATGGVVAQYGLGLIARVTQSSGLPVSLNDTGLPATPYSVPAGSAYQGTSTYPYAILASAINPTSPNTDTASIGGTITTPVHQLDLIIPKNQVGSTLNWRWTFWAVVSDGEIMVDWKRDKNSEFKVSFGLLMNLGQALGQNLFRCQEEY